VLAFLVLWGFSSHAADIAQPPYYQPAPPAQAADTPDAINGPRYRLQASQPYYYSSLHVVNTTTSRYALVLTEYDAEKFVVRARGQCSPICSRSYAAPSQTQPPASELLPWVCRPPPPLPPLLRAFGWEGTTWGSTSGFRVNARVFLSLLHAGGGPGREACWSRQGGIARPYGPPSASLRNHEWTPSGSHNTFVLRLQIARKGKMQIAFERKKRYQTETVSDPMY